MFLKKRRGEKIDKEEDVEPDYESSFYLNKYVLMAAFVILAGAVTFSFLSTDKIVNERCILMPNLNCLDQTITTDKIGISVANDLKEHLLLTLSIDGCDGKVIGQVKKGASQVFEFDCTLRKGKVIDKKVFIKYVGYSGLEHKKEGWITGRVT